MILLRQKRQLISRNQKVVSKMRFVYRPNHPQASENGMVDISLTEPKGVDPKFYVIGDEMPSLRHMADGKMYSSKKKFRDATRAAGCYELGNELPTLTKPRKRIELDRRQRRDDIKKAIYQIRNGQRVEEYK